MIAAAVPPEITAPAAEPAPVVEVVVSTAAVKEVKENSVPVVLYLLIVAIIILIILILVLNKRRKDAEEKQAEPQPEPQPEPVKIEEKPVEQPVEKAEPVKVEPAPKAEPQPEPVKAEAKAAPKKPAKKAPRFYGINSMRDLFVLAKNSSLRADEIKNEIVQLEAEVKALNSEIRKTEDEKKRDSLRAEKNAKKKRINYLNVNGPLAESSADDYTYLYNRVSGEKADFRKTERFNEKNVNISEYDVVWMKKHLGLK